MSLILTCITPKRKRLIYSVGKVHVELDLLGEDVKGRAGDIVKYDVPQIEN